MTFDLLLHAAFDDMWGSMLEPARKIQETDLIYELRVQQQQYRSQEVVTFSGFTSGMVLGKSTTLLPA